MNTLEFLRRVLPSSGSYCAAVGFYKPDDPKMYIKQRFYRRIDELAAFLFHVSERGHNVYHALAAFDPAKIVGTKGRKQENVSSVKCVALDLDVGKVKNSYATRRDALAALADFLSRVHLPKPMIISSGMGLHVYWVLDRDISRDEWQPMADALKNACVAHGMIIDPTITADAARVLRPTDTLHVKSGNRVKLLMDAADTSLEDMLSALQAYVAPSTSAMRGFAAAKASMPAGFAGRQSAVDISIKPPEFPPAVGWVVASKCNQIAKAVANQKDVDEPLWYSLLGVAAYTTDPEATAKQWSKDNPRYDETKTLDKLKQWKESTTGPATCARFEMANPAGCRGCIFKGKIKSPVALGRAYSEAPVDVSAPDPLGAEIPLPRPFKRTTSGIKITIEDTDIDVCPFDIYPVGYGRDEALGFETVRFHWNRPHVGWCLLSFRQALLTDGHRDFASVMADNGIVLHNSKQTEFFQVMLRGYADELRKRKAMSNLYASMGWKENHTQFILGDTAIKRDETGRVVEEQTSLSQGAKKNSGDMYATAGDLPTWADGSRVLEVANMSWHMFALNMGFAAPLFAFTGLKGLTVSLYGPTGGGKTLIQYWIQSIYGDPDKLHFAAKFTQNTLFSRLALYNNLPMTIDEATMLEDKEVGDFLYWVSQGRDKARLNRAAEEREAKTWSTPVIVSTNISMQSKLVSSGIETDAQMARLLEVTIPAHPLFQRNSDAGQKIYAHLMSNYGLAGREFLKELISIGDAGLRAMVEDARSTFASRYNAQFAGEERYWEMAIVLADLAASIAHRLGLVKYDYTKGTRWVLDQLGAIRHSVQENRADTFDLLSAYLNEMADCAVTVMHTASQQKPAVDTTRMPRGEIRVRFDVHRTHFDKPFTHGTLFLDRGHFRKWLSLHGADFKNFMHDLDAAGINVTPKSERIVLGKDTGIKVGMMYVIGIDLKHPRLIGTLTNADEALERVAEAKLVRLVPNGENT